MAERRDIGELLVIEEAQFPSRGPSGYCSTRSRTPKRAATRSPTRKIASWLPGLMFVLNELHINTIGTLPKKRAGGSRRPARDARATRRNAASRARLGGRSVQPARDRPLLRYGFRPVGVRRTITRRPTRMLDSLGRSLDGWKNATYAGMMGLVLGIETSCDETAASSSTRSFTYFPQ